MGFAIEFGEFILNLHYQSWLHLSIFPKLGWFAVLCVLGVATFAISAKICGVLDIRELINLCKRRKNNEASQA